MDLSKYDVVIVGAGNAGLSCAISSAERGKSVVVLEKSPKKFRGGNSSLTMNFRFYHNNVDDLLELIDPKDRCIKKTAELKKKYQIYSKKDFHDDVMKVNDNESSPELVETLVNHSLITINWMRKHGHEWVYKDSGNILPKSVPIRIKDRGAGLQSRNFHICETLGVNFIYDCSLIDFTCKYNKVLNITFDILNEKHLSNVKSLVLACGGFQGNKELREKILGEKWGDVSLRGVPYNTGDWYYPALRNDLKLSKGFGGCHATPQGVNIPKYRLPGENDDSQKSSRYNFNLGVTVNKIGKRFFDEGEYHPNFLYSKIGKSIFKQNDGVAFQLFDSKVIKLINYSYYYQNDFFRSNSIDVLGRKFDISLSSLMETIEEFNNSHSNKNNDVDVTCLDGNSTNGLLINKSNWSQPLDEPPFYIAPVKIGLTFTYGGLEVTKLGNVTTNNNNVIENMYACGECMGGIHIKNYAGGTGLILGAVFGKIIGEQI